MEYLKYFILLLDLSVFIVWSEQKPRFENVPYLITIEEELPIGTRIFQLSATSQSSSPVVYELESVAAGKIRVNESSGELFIAGRLDSESKQETLSFAAFAYELGSTDKVKESVEIFIKNINDNAPSFVNLPSAVAVKEDAATSTFVFKISAVDADQGAQLIYTIATPDVPFRIPDAYEGRILTTALLDYEKQPRYELKINVTDSTPRSPGHINSSILIVNIIDVDDLGAEFDQTTYFAAIDEGFHKMTSLVRVHAFDKDKSINASVTYSIDAATNSLGLFVINETTGQIFFNGTVDRESLSGSSKVLFRVLAASTVHSPAISTVEVSVQDINDNQPSFPQNMYVGRVAENAVQYTPIIQVVAQDRDSGNNSKIGYCIINSNLLFGISETGMIFVNCSLNREMTDTYLVEIEASELYTKEMYSSRTNVTIIVIDANDNSPKFNNSIIEASVQENMANAFIIQVHATDADSGTNAELVYSIVPDAENKHLKFRIGSEDGSLYTKDGLDREESSQYSLLVKAEDKAPLGQRRESIVTIKIRVLDQNDNKPMFESKVYTAPVTEAANLNTIVKALKAIDMDEGVNAVVRYSIIEGNNKGVFDIEPYSGILKTAKELDRETQALYNLTVVAVDGGNLSSTAEVIIEVLDINDNSPVFNVTGGYQFSVTEGVKGAVVGTVKATDNDEGLAGQVTYAITNSDRFSMDENNGLIKTSVSLDHEERSEYIITVVAADKLTTSPRRSYEQVRIRVLDVNDNSPEFVSPKQYSTVVLRNSAPSTVVYNFRATDADAGLNGQFQFLTIPTFPDFLKLNSSTGQLELATPIPVQTNSTVDIAVLASDFGNPSLNDTATLRILISAVLLDAPALDRQIIRASIFENLPSGFAILDLNATYQDKPVDANLQFAILHGGDGNFIVQPSSGVITSTAELDRETKSEYTLIVMVKFQDQVKSNFGTIIITVLDKNDNSPVFSEQTQKLNIPENHNISKSIFKASATDLDEGDNQRIYYSLPDPRSFAINSDTGELYSKFPFDRESISGYTVQIVGENKFATPNLKAGMSLEITITDYNDNSPRFESSMFNFSVPENATVGHVVGSVKAIDDDEGLNAKIKYSINYQLSSTGSDCFTVKFDTGEIKVTCSLDRELVSQYKIMARATDGGTPSLSSSVPVFIEITDVNDNLPKFTKRKYSFQASESLTKGSLIGTFSVDDPDAAADVFTFHILRGNEDGIFNLNAQSGELVLEKALDRESKSTFVLTIGLSVVRMPGSRRKREASTDQKMDDQVDATIIVEDINDNLPMFTKTLYVAAVKEDALFDTVITIVEAVDQDIGNYSLIAFQVNNDSARLGFAVDKYDGKVRLKKSLVGDAGKTYILSIMAKDNGGNDPSNVATRNAIVHLHVINDNHIGRISAGVEGQRLYSNLQIVTGIIESALGGTITIHRIEPTKSKDFWVIVIHAVDEKRNYILTASEISSRINNQGNESIRSDLAVWNITAPLTMVTGQQIKEEDNHYLAIGIAGIVLFFLLLLVVIGILISRKLRRRRKLMKERNHVNNNLPPGNIQPIHSSSKSIRYYLESYESKEEHMDVASQTNEVSEENKGFSNPFYTVEETENNEAPQTSYLSYGTLSSQAAVHWAYAEDDEAQEVADEVDEIMAEKLANKVENETEMVTTL